MEITLQNINSYSTFNELPHSPLWDSGKEKELLMHRIHLYPAKFPSFLISECLKYAQEKQVPVNTIGDIFCGCGTTALEAKINSINFWGCDINPVATLIAEVKSQTYEIKELKKYYHLVLNKYNHVSLLTPEKYLSNQRIIYWFTTSQIHNLYRLLHFIEMEIPQGIYRDFFLVAFSNILKGASRWLTKSIKPTIDKKKKKKDVRALFCHQAEMMVKAVEERNRIAVDQNTETRIETTNFLNIVADNPRVDMLITSPPYVTSYEYADLHQLSTLWLGYVEDFRTLRAGTLGSVYHTNLNEKDFEVLNKTGQEIYQDLIKAKKSNAKSVAKYFLDIKNTVAKTYSIINPGGLAVFVIGNTKLKGVYVDNAKYLTECMFENGFVEVDIYKRRISNKLLSPFRDKDGKFSNDKRKRSVYSYEFVIIAQRPYVNTR
jgi:DNA modification methylase